MYRILFVILICFPLLVLGQVKNVGLPYINNFTRSEYNAGTQNWGISQDKYGFMYFANNDGVLRFDGFHWELIPVSLSLVRSVLVDSKNRIFVAPLYDFGYLEQNHSGKYYYKSLLDLVPENQKEFNDVWRIHEIDGNIIFQSYEKLFIYDGERIEVIKPVSRFRFSFNVNGRFWVQEPGVGLFQLSNGVLERVPWSEPLNDFQILEILAIGENRLLIGTAGNGMFQYDHGVLSRWKTEANEFINENKLYSATTILGNNLALGTITGGVIITNTDGEIIQHLDHDKGLQNNTILSLFADKNKDLWLGLDNGIDYLQINSPISYIGPQEHIGTGYCATIFRNKLYLGTNQGLFVKPFNNFLQSDEEFRLVENTAGQVWSLGVYNDQLICGHDLGTYIVESDKALKISDKQGVWGYTELNNNPGVLLGGYYNGLVTLKDSGQGWEVVSKVKGFEESSRFLFRDEEGSIWMGHGGKGIYRLRLNEGLDSVLSVELFGKLHGLPANTQNLLFKVQNKIIVSTVDGCYRFYDEKNRFEKAEDIDRLLGFSGRIKTVKTDDNNNIWYIGENEAGVLRQNEDLSYTKITSPFEALAGHFVNEFEFVFPLDNDHVFFGIDDGFAHYSAKFPKSYQNDYQAYVTKVELGYLDTVLYPTTMPDAPKEFPKRKNSFRFHYTAPFYENMDGLQFSYFLENYSEDWSPWSSDIYNDFTNLPYGDYVFKVKALNNYGIESSTHEFTFTILPPWYRTPFAHTTYSLFGLVLLLGTIAVVRYRVKKSQNKAREAHEKEMREKDRLLKHQSVIAEKAIIKLRNDKLRSEMIHRDKELANQTNNIIQKNKLLQKINLELQKIQSTTDDGAVKSKVVILKRRIQKEIDDKQQNRIFETYFDEVHKEFFERLKDKFPQLSPKDLRLCAYIRMNISTKEIATLLNISFRGVEISRYRLRKKMELSRDINLSTFLAGI